MNEKVPSPCINSLVPIPGGVECSRPARTLNSHPGASEGHPGPCAVPTALCTSLDARGRANFVLPSRVCRSRSAPFSSRTFTTMFAVLEGDYKVDKVLAIVRRDGQDMAWTRWINYNFLGDTLEPLSHIFPRSKLMSFLKGKSVSVDLSQPRRKLNLSIISQMTSNKIKERGPFTARR
eukprot:5894780-Prymnesium_polylepis.1